MDESGYYRPKADIRDAENDAPESNEKLRLLIFMMFVEAAPIG